MKNSKKLLYKITLLLGVIGIFFSSCSEDLVKSDYDYQIDKTKVLSTLKFDSLVLASDEKISLYSTILSAGESNIYDFGYIYSNEESFKTYTAVSVKPDTLGDLVTLTLEELKISQGKNFYFRAYVLTKDGLAVSVDTRLVNLPITWENVGVVQYVDDFWQGAEAEIIIQKFFGQNRYRLVDLFNKIDIAAGISESERVPAGKHLEFTLDNDWNAVSLPVGDQDVFVGIYTFYYDPAIYPKYCYFTNEANSYTIGFLCKEEGEVAYLGTGSFTWTTGYPGVIPEPKVPINVTYKTDFSTETAKSGWELDVYSGVNETDNVFFFDMSDAGAAELGTAIGAIHDTVPLKISSPSFNITAETDTLSFGYYSGLFQSGVNAKVKVYIRVVGQALDLNNPVMNWDLATGPGSAAIPLNNYAGKTIKVIIMVEQGDFLFYHFAIGPTSDESLIFQ